MPLNANSNGTTVWGNVGLQGSVLAPGGVDVSQAVSGTLPQMTKLRTLADRFSDRLSVQDFGVIGDGVVDDTLAFQLALNQTAGKASLLIIAGLIVLVSDTILIPPGSDLVIDGDIFLKNGSNCPVLQLMLGDKFSIRGTGSIDGNRANQIPGNSGLAGIGGTQLSMSQAQPTTNVLIRDITIKNCFHWPINILNVTGGLIFGVTMNDSGAAPECAFGCSDIIVDSIRVNNNPDYGWAFYQCCWNCILVNSIFTNTAVIGVLNDSASVGSGWNHVPSHNILIANNMTINSASFGATVQNDTGVAASNHFDIDIIGNTFIDSGVSNTGNGAGVFVVNASRVRVHSNTIIGGGTANSTWVGIGGNGNFCSIRFNTICNGGSTAAGVISTGLGFGFLNTVYDNNNIFDDQAVHTMTYGAGSVGSPTISGQCTFTFNRIHGCSASFPTATPFASDTIVFSQTLQSQDLWTITGIIKGTASVQFSGGIDAIGTANNLGITGSSTGSPCTIQSFGADTNIDLNYSAKGSGSHNFDGQVNVTGSITATGADYEFGSTTTTAVVVHDFHTSGTGNDFDVRMAASGGTSGTNGAGSLTFTHGKLSFFGASAQAKPTVSGSKGGNAALASLITALAAYGLVIDTTT